MRAPSVNAKLYQYQHDLAFLESALARADQGNESDAVRQALLEDLIRTLTALAEERGRNDAWRKLKAKALLLAAEFNGSIVPALVALAVSLARDLAGA